MSGRGYSYTEKEWYHEVCSPRLFGRFGDFFILSGDVPDHGDACEDGTQPFPIILIMYFNAGVTNMKLSFSTLACPGYSWAEIYSTAKDFGFHGIEMRGLGDDIFSVHASPFLP